MKTLTTIFIFSFLCSVTFVPVLRAQVIPEKDIAAFARSIDWFGQAGVKINTGKQIIYIDPFRIKKPDQKADIIFITHDHKDHLDPASISMLLTDSTIIVAPLSCKNVIDKNGYKNTVFLSPWDSTAIAGIPVKAVPAYNIDKPQFHPKSKNYLGYIMTINGIDIYHAGDTERIPEMQQFDCDIALLPLGQKYTMNSVYDAANSALDVKAKIAIPIHWGMFEGSLNDVEQFQKILQNKIEVIVLDNKSNE